MAQTIPANQDWEVPNVLLDSLVEHFDRKQSDGSVNGKPSSHEEKLAPVNNLPPEILACIFDICQAVSATHSIDAYDDPDDNDDLDDLVEMEILLSHVCGYWRDVALSAPHLWCRLDLTQYTPEEYTQTYLSRSASCLLDVSINFADCPQPDQINQQLLDSVFNHIQRWKSCWIHVARENPHFPVVSRLREVHTPFLEYLSVSVTELDHHVVQHEILPPQLLKGGANKLSFVRLRGLGMDFFRPPFTSVTTLHLDQTKALFMSYDQFRHLLTIPDSLLNLSIYGEIIGFIAWPPPDQENVIPLHQLRSLRICGMRSFVYSGILRCVDAPQLESLVLRGMSEHDLEPFCGSAQSQNYKNLRSLTFCDFDLSEATYHCVFTCFPSILDFTVLKTSLYPPRILKALLEPDQHPPTHGLHLLDTAALPVPWPKLQTLSFNLYFEDQIALLKNTVEARLKQGHAISILRIRKDDSFSPGADYEWVEEHVKIEKLSSFHWPDERDFVDTDDYLLL